MVIADRPNSPFSLSSRSSALRTQIPARGEPSVPVLHFTVLPYCNDNMYLGFDATVGLEILYLVILAHYNGACLRPEGYPSYQSNSPGDQITKATGVRTQAAISRLRSRLISQIGLCRLQLRTRIGKRRKKTLRQHLSVITDSLQTNIVFDPEQLATLTCRSIATLAWHGQIALSYLGDGSC